MGKCDGRNVTRPAIKENGAVTFSKETGNLVKDPTLNSHITVFSTTANPGHLHTAERKPKQPTQQQKGSHFKSRGTRKSCPRREIRSKSCLKASDDSTRLAHRLNDPEGIVGPVLGLKERSRGVHLVAERFPIELGL